MKNCKEKSFSYCSICGFYEVLASVFYRSHLRHILTRSPTLYVHCRKIKLSLSIKKTKPVTVGADVRNLYTCSYTCSYMCICAQKPISCRCIPAPVVTWLGLYAKMQVNRLELKYVKMFLRNCLNIFFILDLLSISIGGCSGCETRVIVINPQAYMYINPRTVTGENAPIAFMKYISLS